MGSLRAVFAARYISIFLFLFLSLSFFFVAKPSFAADVSVSGGEVIDVSAEKQCSDANKAREADMLCRYSPLEQRCREKRQARTRALQAAAIAAVTDANAALSKREKPWQIPTPAPVRRPAVPYAPHPFIFKVENGRKVCGTKNDHPRKSQKGKGKHMDMECCLDPDEYPNPHCYYPPEKYGKYLKPKH